MEYYVDEIPVFYKEYGEGIPILCLHGYTVDHRLMVGCIEPIFQSISGYRRIYLDLPGMGQTPSSPNIKNADDMLDILKKFISGVIGEEQFLLVGESYGGYLSLGLIHSQQKIGGMFLICPAIIADVRHRELPSEEDMGVPIVETKETRARYENEIQPGLSVADKAFTSRYREEGYSFSFAGEITGISFNHPAALILGRQDEAVGYMDALKLIKNFTRATFVVADSASHNLQIERKNMFETCFIDWIERLESD